MSLPGSLCCGTPSRSTVVIQEESSTHERELHAQSMNFYAIRSDTVAEAGYLHGLTVK